METCGLVCLTSSLLQDSIEDVDNTEGIRNISPPLLSIKTQTQVQGNSNVFPSATNVRLPEINIPLFRGDISEFLFNKKHIT